MSFYRYLEITHQNVCKEYEEFAKNWEGPKPVGEADRFRDCMTRKAELERKMEAVASVGDCVSRALLNITFGAEAVTALSVDEVVMAAKEVITERVAMLHYDQELREAYRRAKEDALD